MTKIKVGYLDPINPQSGLCVINCTGNHSQIVTYKGQFEAYAEQMKSDIVGFFGRRPQIKEIEFTSYMGSQSRDRFVRLFGYL